MVQTGKRSQNGYERGSLHLLLEGRATDQWDIYGFYFGLYKLQVGEGRWFVYEQLEDSMTWEMKEVLGLKRVDGVFDSNQCARKSTSGRISTGVLTNSKCMADELRLRWKCFIFKVTRWKCFISTPWGATSLDRFAMGIGIFKSGSF